MLSPLRIISFLIISQCQVRVALAPCSAQSSWCKLSLPCTSSADAPAVVESSTWNENNCLLKLVQLTDPKRNSTPSDNLVAQWNKQSRMCSIFHYQNLCKLIQYAINASAISGNASTQNASSSVCSVYRMNVLPTCNTSLDYRFTGVWLAGGNSRFSNLVCQSDPTNYQLVGVNLTWSEEGAVFDGVSSYAILNDTRFMPGPVNSSFTWLMRVKRDSKVQPFIEARSCTVYSDLGPHLWEYQFQNQIFYGTQGRTSPLKTFESTGAVLPNSNGSWVDIGITFNPLNQSVELYYNGSFLTAVTINTAVTLVDPQITCYILWIGHRFETRDNFLKGIVRAVAVANATMALPDIRNFFSLIRG